MKIRHLLVVGLLLFSTFVFAQSKQSNKNSAPASVSWGPDVDGSNKSIINKIIGHDEDYYYVLFEEVSGMFGRKTYYIEKYDLKMKQLASEEIILDGSSKKREFESVIYFNNEMYLLSSYNDKKQDFKYLYIQRVDKSNLIPEKKLTQIADIDYNEYRQSDFGSFLYEISADSSKLFFHYILPSKKKMKQKFGLKVFDKELSLLWEKNITVPYLDELFWTQSYRIDNEGNIYILAKVYKDKVRDKRKGKPNYKYQLITVKNNGEEYKEYPVELKDKFITDLQIEVNSNMDIVCGGFYSKIGTYSIDGCCFLNIDGQTGDIRTKSTKEFDLEFLTQDLTDRQKKRVQRKTARGRDLELYEYNLDHLVIREDGGVLMVGEQYWVVVYTYRDANGITHTYYEYNYNDIFIVNVNPEGKIDWAQKIPKRQTTTSDPLYFSYSFATVGNDLYFIYNDHEDNIDYEGDGEIKTLKSVKNSFTMLAHVDSQGNISIDPLFKNERGKAYLLPLACQQVSSDEVIAYAKRGKMEKFAKIKYTIE